MSFIGGILQGLLADAVKESILSYKPPTPEQNRKNWIGCLWVFGIIIVVIYLISLFIPASKKPKKMTDSDIVRTVQAGDSIFVRDDRGIDFYKKGKVKLTDYEQREVKYAYEERTTFFDVNNVHDRLFFKNKTSFIGICVGVDTLTDGRWIIIKPSNAVTHPPKRKGPYDYETRRWEEKKYDILNNSKLSKEYYVRPSDILLKNNDKIFK